MNSSPTTSESSSTARDRALVLIELERRRRARAFVPPTFRAFLESPDYCGLTLSPLVAAIADVSEGRAADFDDDLCATHFGCAAAELPSSPRRTVAVRAGGRGGKTSRLLAPKALHAAWTVLLPTLNRGEVASALLVAPDMKLARQALSFVHGYVDGSPILRAARVGAPTKDSVTLRRPDGATVRVEVLAASRGGRAVRARTLVFAGLDEAAFFFSEDSGVVNDTEIFRAVIQRVVPGGQVWIVSTPWVADVGLLEQTLAKGFGTHEHALCATAPTRALNPTWDPDREIERELRETDPDNAAREIDAIPLVGGSNAFFDPHAIKSAINEARPLVISTPPESAVGFGSDLAFTADSSALVGAARTGTKYTALLIEEMRPAKDAPLKPKDVIDAFAKTIKGRGGREFYADAHYKESAREHLQPHGVRFVDAPGGRDGKTETYLLLKKLLHEGRIEIPNHARLIAQLRAVVSKPAPGGGFIISTPRQRYGGGHGDLVSALVLAVWAVGSPKPSVYRSIPAHIVA